MPRIKLRIIRALHNGPIWGNCAMGLSHSALLSLNERTILLQQRNWHFCFSE
jgi:hypothetical protein